MFVEPHEQCRFCDTVAVEHLSLTCLQNWFDHLASTYLVDWELAQDSVP